MQDMRLTIVIHYMEDVKSMKGLPVAHHDLQRWNRASMLYATLRDSQRALLALANSTLADYAPVIVSYKSEQP